MRRKVMATAMAGLLSASMAMSAFAAPEVDGDANVDNSQGGVGNYEEGTEVKAGVIVDDPDAKIKVEVPTLFAFVVNGTVESESAGDSISVENGSLLLPNAMVTVDTSKGEPEHRAYNIDFEAGNQLHFDNFSTMKVKGLDGNAREGLEVYIKGAIENKGTLESRNYWEHVEYEPSTQRGEDFKKYRLNVNGIEFSEVEEGMHVMADTIKLDAPRLGRTDLGSGEYKYDNLDTETNFAKNPNVQYVDFGVEVGGTRGDYTTVEASAKVGTIVWTVSTPVEANNDVTTAPDGDYQQEPTPTEETM